MSLASAAKSTTARISRSLHSAFGQERGGAGVLLFHRVAACPSADSPGLAVPPDIFAAQLRGLIELGYRFLPLETMVAALVRGERLAPFTVAVTFDDGYACVASGALPALLAERVPATVFLATQFIGQFEPFPFDGWGKRNRKVAAENLWRPLAWYEIRTMAASGLVDFGSHGHAHRAFAGDEDGFDADLRLSRERFAQELGHAPRLFAYPGGARSLGLASAAMAKIVEAHGFSAAFTTEYGTLLASQDRFLLPRYEVTAEDNAGTIAAKLAGWHDWAASLREVYRVPRRLFGNDFGR